MKDNKLTMENKLRVLSKWLKEYHDEAFVDGLVELEIQHAVNECMHKIGDYTEEILDMNEEQINNEL